MVCLMDNGRAERMAPRLAGTMRFAQGEAEAGIEPPWPTPWTWLEEALSESVVPGARAGGAPAWPLAPLR